MREIQRQPSSATVQDPICGMTLDPGQAYASRVQGSETLSFCSEHCVRQFDRDHTGSATTGVSDGRSLHRIELPVASHNDRQGATYLEEQLKALPGIAQATANSKTHVVGITYDPMQTSVAAIAARIRTAGYTAGMATTQIAI
jgi:P-type Cu+ transporter